MRLAPAPSPWVSLALCLLAAPAWSDDIQALRQEIDALQKKVSALETEQRREGNYTLQKLESLDTLAKRVKINGFLSIGYSTLDGGGSNSGLNLYGVRDSLASQANMVAGAQMDTKISDRLRTSLQFVSRGVEKNELSTEWAYFAYDISDQFTVRGGRLRAPQYAYSDVLDIAYAYPWVRPPVEMYNLPLDNYEGFSVLYDDPFGDWQGQIEVYYGSVLDDDPIITGINFNLDEYWGSVLSLSREDLSLRAAYHRTHATVELLPGGVADQLTQGLLQAQTLADGLNALFPNSITSAFTPDSVDQYAGFATVSAIYDDGVWYVAAEYAKLQVDYELFPAGDSGYISFGRHFGAWLPYFTAATNYTDANHDASVNDRIAGAEQIAGILDGLGAISDIDPDPFSVVTPAEAAAGMRALADGMRKVRIQQDSYTLGFGYTVTEGLKLKFEAKRFSDFGESNGLFAGGSPGKRGAAYFFVVNTVF